MRRICNDYGFLSIPSMIYLMVFAAVWMGFFEMPLYAYLIAFVFLLFFTYMFLHGAYYISHSGEKVQVEYIDITEFDKDTFKKMFHASRDKKEKRSCVIKFMIDGQQRYELIEKSYFFKCIPGHTGYVFVIRHKIGAKVDYQIRTIVAYMGNVLSGIWVLFMTIGWIILFIFRGI